MANYPSRILTDVARLLSAIRVGEKRGHSSDVPNTQHPSTVSHGTLTSCRDQLTRFVACSFLFFQGMIDYTFYVISLPVKYQLINVIVEGAAS